MGTGVCVACGAGDIEMNDEQKCAHCGGDAGTEPTEAPAEVPAEVPVEETPAAE